MCKLDGACHPHVYVVHSTTCSDLSDPFAGDYSPRLFDVTHIMTQWHGIFYFFSTKLAVWHPAVCNVTNSLNCFLSLVSTVLVRVHSVSSVCTTFHSMSPLWYGQCTADSLPFRPAYLHFTIYLLINKFWAKVNNDDESVTYIHTEVKPHFRLSHSWITKQNAEWIKWIAPYDPITFWNRCTARPNKETWYSVQAEACLNYNLTSDCRWLLIRIKACPPALFRCL